MSVPPGGGLGGDAAIPRPPAPFPALHGLPARGGPDLHAASSSCWGGSAAADREPCSVHAPSPPSGVGMGLVADLVLAARTTRGRGARLLPSLRPASSVRLPALEASYSAVLSLLGWSSMNVSRLRRGSARHRRPPWPSRPASAGTTWLRSSLDHDPEFSLRAHRAAELGRPLPSGRPGLLCSAGFRGRDPWIVIGIAFTL